MQKKGTSITELIFTLAIIALLIFIGPPLIKRFVKSSKNKEFKSEQLDSTPHLTPWTRYKSLPPIVEKHKETLKKWTARDTKNPEKPFVLKSEERNFVLKDIYKELSSTQKLPPLPDASILETGFFPINLISDEKGNAILAGGLVVSAQNFIVFILKNNGDIVNFNKFENNDWGYPRLNLIHQWMWHRKEDQQLVTVAYEIKDALTRPPQDLHRNPSSYLVYIDGIRVEANLRKFTSSSKNGSGLGNVLGGEITNLENKKSTIGGYWTKDFYEQYTYQYTLDNGYLGVLKMHGTY